MNTLTDIHLKASLLTVEEESTGQSATLRGSDSDNWLPGIFYIGDYRRIDMLIQ
ncbi:hypothetical protein ACQKDS_07335 [Serratia sp. NPDC078593]|uniref:hypothetical protein n=1 Tax=unclassified Serratia (in: enterobacteria) TaxID=2647522 RepID=UPI0037D129CB